MIYIDNQLLFMVLLCTHAAYNIESPLKIYPHFQITSHIQRLKMQQSTNNKKGEQSMKKSTNLIWRLLIAVILVFSLVSALSLQVTAPATVSAASAPLGCPKMPASPSPANLATGVSIYTNLSWGKTVNATLFDVWFDTDYDGNGGTEVASQISVLSVTNVDLVNELGSQLECCTDYYWKVVAWNASGQCSNSSLVWQFTTSPLVGAATGWTWVFPYNTVGTRGDEAQPYDTNTRNSIMVILDKSCQENYIALGNREDGGGFSLLNASNFKVTYTISQNGRIQSIVNETPKAAVYHDWHEDSYLCKGDESYGLVFLTLSKPMATDATPTVYYIGSNKAVLGSTVADDGIAPIVDLTISGSPYLGGLITVTATATEPLTNALIVVKDVKRGADTLPTTNYFPVDVQEANEYGGYCTQWWRDHTLRSYGDTELQEMDQTGSNTAAYTFNTEALAPGTNLFVEVYAHDNTYCDGYYQYWDIDQSCKWWRHETWSSSSQSITGTDTIDLHLVEGWNLISFPRTPADPILSGVFGDEIVNKVYTYIGGRWYGAIYDSASGNWVAPSGIGVLTSVQGGVGYWVYCSAAGTAQDFCSRYLKYIFEDFGRRLDTNVAWTDLLVQLSPAAVGAVTPPSYSLSAGWNLIGVPVQGSLDQYQLSTNSKHETEVLHAPVTQVSDFLSSINGHWKAIYWYLPLFTIWSDQNHGPDESYTFASGYLGATPDTAQDFNWRLAYWMTAFGGISPIPQDGYNDPFNLAGLNQDIAPVVMPGFGYWVWTDQAGTLVPVQ